MCWICKQWPGLDLTKTRGEQLHMCGLKGTRRRRGDRKWTPIRGRSKERKSESDISFKKLCRWLPGWRQRVEATKIRRTTRAGIRLIFIVYFTHSKHGAHRFMYTCGTEICQNTWPGLGMEHSDKVQSDTSKILGSSSATHRYTHTHRGRGGRDLNVDTVKRKRRWVNRKLPLETLLLGGILFLEISISCVCKCLSLRSQTGGRGR